MRDLAHYVRVYDDCLPAALCDSIRGLFDARRDLVEANGAGVRPGLEHSAWEEIDLANTRDGRLGAQLVQLAGDSYQRYNADVGLTLPISPPRNLDRWIAKHYRVGGKDQFQPHFDSLGPVCNRYLVMLWYLNDVDDGGGTRFVDLDLTIDARQGRLLMFPPYWMYQHAGLPPLSNSKYILSTYLTY